jgi:hypothetical protein
MGGGDLMKIGTFVKPTEDVYPRTDQYIRDLSFGIPLGSSSGFMFSRGEVGIVLELFSSSARSSRSPAFRNRGTRMKDGFLNLFNLKDSDVYAKILTPKGVGWVRWDWIEVIS